jgi:hypothetical protein
MEQETERADRADNIVRLSDVLRRGRLSSEVSQPITRPADAADDDDPRPMQHEMNTRLALLPDTSRTSAAVGHRLVDHRKSARPCPASLGRFRAAQGARGSEGIGQTIDRRRRPLLGDMAIG